MQIAIFDGDARAPGSALDRELALFIEQAAARGDRCERLRLASLKLHQCVGCFDCWVKTPGRCRLRDDGGQLVAALVRADLVVFAAPMRMGFVVSLLKRANDRSIPVLLPYIDVTGGECHNFLRYHALDVALLVERGDATAEELGATERIYRRLAKNMSGKFAWFKVVEEARTEELVSTDNSRKEQIHALGAH
jgi:hypothetical protein